jgi:glucose/arabinose dehydrogenase
LWDVVFRGALMYRSLVVYTPGLKFVLRGFWVFVATAAGIAHGYAQSEPFFFPLNNGFARSEGHEPNPYTVVAWLSVQSSNTVSVQWFTSDGTARAGLDYAGDRGTIVFPPGITNRSFAVTVLGDMLPNTNRTFYIHFTNAINATLRTNQVLATILDDDELFLPPGFSKTTFATNISFATDMAFAPDGRLFVCQQEGRMWIMRHGAEVTPPFLRLTVTNSAEAGLLGMAFDPGFASNNFLYVYYTLPPPNQHNRISRFTAGQSEAVPGSERVILEIDPSLSRVHLGGGLRFGPDGKLYVSVGDHLEPNNAQRLDSLFGKILRINPDGTIPEDNPFYHSATGVYRAIWALGLRNPFSFAIDPEHGRVLINDVGQGSWEELNEGSPGGNYGWPFAEGPTGSPSYMDPIYSYRTHVEGCAIVGAAFYRPQKQLFPPEYSGNYFFSDLCGQWIRRLTSSNTVQQFCTNFSGIDIEVGLDGALYILPYDYNSPTSVERIGYGPRLRAIRLLPGNQVMIHAWGAPERTYHLELSSDLISWQSMTSAIPAVREWEFSDMLPAAPSHRFYRIREEGF